MQKFLVVIAGPTGIGKTHTAIELAARFGTEILSADSRQIYKELRIGTAAPSPEELSAVRHHFVQNKSIFDEYNAGVFETEALHLLERLFLQKNIVLMTGGSGLYIDAVISGIDDLPRTDPEIRKNLTDIWHAEGIESLRLQLKTLDPRYYATADMKNPKRILKALEVAILTGKPYSAFLTASSKTRPFSTLLIGLNTSRKKLYDTINHRVDRMISNGLAEEARSVFSYKHLNSLNTVGYKEMFRYLEGEISLEEAADLIKRNTRKYARRQLTWFRKYNDMEWFEPDDAEPIYRHILQKIKENRASFK